ncbi:cytochrome b [Polynucleobacter sp. AP-Nino-20-G2]|uniref:cytochrome b n=1 Tax=Polynucleobacter sp. AP-Nino-20-G2 TaxID=2576917 RepID=UPI001BFE8974|nr:cytochrome b [Polynucleobacter sp. AP-Nino-20-G2]QWE15911.1 cytochrome b [Polynucleobacter sp. AP-Nino-20-G2]
MPNTRYHPLAIFFHWLIFILVAAALLVIELKGQYPKGSKPRELCKTIHSFIGQIIFIAMIMRLIVRLKFGTPTPLNPNQALVVSAKIMHWLLYALLLTLPVMGFVFLQAGGKEVHFLGWVWPQLIEPDPNIKKIFKELHESLGTSIYFLVGIHAAGALWQHYILKNETLRRMLNKSTQ